MKYLIIGLGNIGDEYHQTRHNIGFMVADHYAEKKGISFQDGRYGFTARCRVKNAELVLLKPSTYMNLSGTAIRYWMQKENIERENILVFVDDINLPFGSIRMRKQGSAGGHNGLKNIEQCLMGSNYARVRFGIGNGFPTGAQINYVLHKFNAEERSQINERLPLCDDIIESFCLQGVDRTMNQYNGK